MALGVQLVPTNSTGDDPQQDLVSLFFSVWLVLWSFGGSFAMHDVVCTKFMCGVPIAPLLVWAILTATFTYVELEDACASSTVFLSVWCLLPLFLVFCSPRVRHNVCRVCGRYWRSCQMTFRRNAPRKELAVPLTMVKLSVRLVSGDLVYILTDFPLNAEVACVAETVERQLSLVGTDRCCQLLCGDRLLTDCARLCDEGVADGAELTAVVVFRSQEEDSPDQREALTNWHPDLPYEEDDLHGPACAFIFVWFCVWLLVEMYVAHNVAVNIMC